jgi:hypothetical protein
LLPIYCCRRCITTTSPGHDETEDVKDAMLRLSMATAHADLNEFEYEWEEEGQQQWPSADDMDLDEAEDEFE